MARAGRRRWLRWTFANMLLVVVSLAVFTLTAEFVVFRYILLPSDVPVNAFHNGIIRYAPHQSGTYRVKNEIAAAYTINAQGWNSGHAAYRVQGTHGKLRIAVVGDSYVEALQVDHDESLAENLEVLMGPDRTEVYRFAISGAPLSQYLYMLENEVLRFAPDRVVILLVHNDFHESFLLSAGRYTSSFMRLNLTGNYVVDEIAPAHYRSTWIDTLRLTATMRYLYYRQQVNLPALRRGLISLVQYGGDPGGLRALEGKTQSPTAGWQEGFEANVDLSALDRDFSRIAIATNYLFGRLKGVSEEFGVRLLLVMDAPRRAIYDGYSHGDESRGAHRLNALAARLAQKHGLPFLDLSEAFVADWRAHGRKFDFSSDGHWNRRTHWIAAEAIYRSLVD